jgi:hypothetical protein
MPSKFETERKRIYNRFSQIHLYSQKDYDQFTMDLFRFQYKYNTVYRDFCLHIGKSPGQVAAVSDIPYLPISAFRHHRVVTGETSVEEVFTSSGTSGGHVSRHFVCNVDHYLSNAAYIWTTFFGPVSQFCFLCLLPGYLEREGSSLIRMAAHFTQRSSYKESGFYLRNHEDLYEKLVYCRDHNIPTVLLGVSYALLDFIEHYSIDFPLLYVMETGGMKGQRREMIKAALHDKLTRAFHIPQIQSEYGMTELLSQAYSYGNNIFYPNSRLSVSTRQIHDPLSVERIGKTGLICVCDLANIDSCAFILTEDIGVVYDDGCFEILGRADLADIRGCNLLLEDVGLI